MGRSLLIVLLFLAALPARAAERGSVCHKDNLWAEETAFAEDTVQLLSEVQSQPPGAGELIDCAQLGAAQRPVRIDAGCTDPGPQRPGRCDVRHGGRSRHALRAPGARRPPTPREALLQALRGQKDRRALGKAPTQKDDGGGDPVLPAAGPRLWRPGLVAPAPAGLVPPAHPGYSGRIDRPPRPPR